MFWKATLSMIIASLIINSAQAVHMEFTQNSLKQDYKIGENSLKDLLLFLNDMKDFQMELLIERMKINGQSNSLAEFLIDAWERNLDFKFESSYLPIYGLCRDVGGILRRRGGAVLEVHLERDGLVKTRKWSAIFFQEDGTGYYLDQVQDAGTFPPGHEAGVHINLYYTCPPRDPVAERKLDTFEMDREQKIRQLEEF